MFNVPTYMRECIQNTRRGEEHLTSRSIGLTNKLSKYQMEKPGVGDQLHLPFPELICLKFKHAVHFIAEKKAALRARDREKKLWEKFTPKPIALPPIHMVEKPKLIPRFWDYDIQPQVIQQVTPEDWEELKFCHYLRNSMPDFKIDSPI